MPTKKVLNVTEILVNLGLPEEVVTDLVSYGEYPDALEMGDRVMLGLALEQLGGKLVAAGKSEALELMGPDKIYRFNYEEGGIKFSFQGASTQTVLNTEKIKEWFPYEKNPEFYTERKVRAFVKVTPA